MKYEFDGIAVGNRIRQARNAKGWSQEMLAEKADTSPQNISKFEKNGLSDMNWITRLSNILDTDLLVNTIDVDGTVSELGKEILISLVKNKGNIFLSDLIRGMFGLSQDDVTKEIVKLANMGLVVREIYVCWYSYNTDRVFITAKGFIVLKNLSLNQEIANLIFNSVNEIRTYENIVGQFESYQEYIDQRPEETLIRTIYDEWYFAPTHAPFPVYKMNYIKFLIKNIETDIDNDAYMEDWLDDTYCPGENCYYDIIYRMAFGLSNTVIAEHETEENWLKYYDFLVAFQREHGKADLIKNNARLMFREFVPGENDDKQLDDEFSLRNMLDTIKEIEDTIKNKMSYLEALRPDEDGFVDIPDDYIENLENQWDEIKKAQEALNKVLLHREIESPWAVYDREIEKHGGMSPTEWFSEQEIRDFIEKNYQLPQNDIEIGIKNKLEEIGKYIPGIESKYYQFPKEWEENGLADLVRTRSGLLINKSVNDN